MIETTGEEQFIPIQVSQLSRYPDYFDLVLVLVKSGQTQLAAMEAHLLLNRQNPNSCILTLQNGLGNKETLEELNPGRVYVGSTTEAARVPEPGTVEHTGKGTVHLPEGMEREVVSVLSRAGIEVSLHSNLDAILWTKLAINSAINPLTALLGMKNGQLLREPLCLAWMEGLTREVERVAKASGIELGDRNLFDEAKAIATRTAGNHSSMLQDMESGRVTEIEAICGAVVRYGQRAGVPVPLNTHMLEWVKQAEGGRHFSLKDLNLPE